MDKNTKIKPSSDPLNKSLDSISNSITEAFCPKYRKFTNFDKQINFESKQIHPEYHTQRPSQQKDIHIHIQNQQANSVANLKHQYKNSQTVSMIDINQSSQIPPLDDKRLSIKIQSLSKDSSLNQSSLISPLPNLKLRRQFMKVRSRDASISQDQLKYQIKDYFNQLNSIIEKTSTHFQKRMKTHEDQLLKIMMLEIKRVNEECQKTICKYNDLIKSKAISRQIDEARLQIMFFRSQALELKKQNQDLKKDIKYLKRLNNQYELKLKTDSDTLKQMGIKLMSQKEKNKSIQRTLLDEVISKKTQKIRQFSSEIQTCSKARPNQCSILEGSKILCLQKINSKSLENTDLTSFRSGQKSLAPMRMKTQFVSSASSNPSFTNSLVMKMNREINKKYKIGQQIEEFCDQSEKKEKQQISDITQSNDVIDTEANREKILRFLKEARPSIKSIIQQKKTINKKPMRKLTDEPNQKELDKIIVIKNRVRLSTFEQERWQELKKKSIDLTVQDELRETVN